MGIKIFKDKRCSIQGVQNPDQGGANAPPSLFLKALSRTASAVVNKNWTQNFIFLTDASPQLDLQ